MLPTLGIVVVANTGNAIITNLGIAVVANIVSFVIVESIKAGVRQLRKFR